MTAPDRGMVERMVASRRDLYSTSARDFRTRKRGWYVRERTDDGDDFVPLAGPFETDAEADRECERINARAAIAAMREPTPEVLTAGDLWVTANEFGESLTESAWRAMIDAALSTPGDER